MRGRTVCGRPVAILVFAKPRHEEVGGPFSIAFSAKWNRLRATSTRRPLRTKCRPQSCCIYRRTTSWTFKQTVVGYEHAMGDVLSFGRHSGQSYEDGCLERRQLWQTREEPGPSQAIQTKLRNGVNRHTTPVSNRRWLWVDTSDGQPRWGPSCLDGAVCGERHKPQESANTPFLLPHKSWKGRCRGRGAARR